MSMPYKNTLKQSTVGHKKTKILSAIDSGFAKRKKGKR